MEAAPLSVIALLRAKPEAIDRVRDQLNKLVSPSRDETGCIQYDLHQSADDPCLFVFYEQWTSEAALASHGASKHIVESREQLKESLVSKEVVRTRPVEASAAVQRSGNSTGRH